MAVIFVILWYNRMTCKNGRIMGNSLGSLWKTWKGGAAMVYTTHYQSLWGSAPGGQGDALAGLWLEGQKYFLGSLKEPAEPMEGHPVLLQAGDWLSRYFAGSGRIPVS